MDRFLSTLWLAAALAWQGALPEIALSCTVCSLGDETPTSLGAGIPLAGKIRIGAEAQMKNAHYGRAGIDRLDVSEQWLLLRGAWSLWDEGMITLQLPLLRRSISFPNLSKDIAYGPGDLEVGARVIVFRDRRYEPRHMIAIRTALELPTGIRTDTGGQPLPIDLQLGSGGLDGRVGMDYAWLDFPFAMFVSVTGQASTAGFLGTVPGPLVLVAATGQVAPLRRFALRVGTQLRWEGPLHFDNGSRDPDSGGVTGVVSPAVVWRPNDGWFVALGIDLPVFQSLLGDQSIGPTPYLEVVFDA